MGAGQISAALLAVLTLGLAPDEPAKQGAGWKPAYYMDRPEFCTEVKPGSALAANSVIKPYLDAAGKGNVPVKECDYTFSSTETGKADRHGWVVLADPPPDVLVGWVRAACVKAAAKTADSCVSALLKNLNEQNGGQFPVLGFVAEGEGNCTRKGIPLGKTGLIAFQDGVTVQLEDGVGGEADYCTIADMDVATQKAMALSRKPFEVFHIARLAGLRDTCGVSLLTPGIDAEAKALNLTSPWLLVSRRNQLAAMETGTDRMVAIQARRFALGTRGPRFNDGCAVDPVTIALP